MKIALLGAGFIARFYATTLHSQRRKDHIHLVYSRKRSTAQQFAGDFNLQHSTDDMEAAINHPDTEVVLIALPNHLHLTAVKLAVKAGKSILCTKPLGRTAEEAKTMLDLVEKKGVFAGYLEDLCYTPKILKSIKAVSSGAIGRVLWTKSREAHPGPHSDWFWNKELSGGGAIIDLACHCVEIGRNLIGKNIRPLEVMCWAGTQVHPIEAEDHAIGLVKYANGAIGQFEVSWTFRGGMDLRDEVMGTEGSIWLNSFLRTGFEMYVAGNKQGYVAEKAEQQSGWLFPVGDEAHELGYPHMFTDMFDAIEENRLPQETFYDGYVVNAILDAALLSANSRKWEPVKLEDWRGIHQQETEMEIATYDDHYFLIKKEMLPNGTHKLILKDKQSGAIIQKEITAI
ncbi:Gfo/Idh/MocA family protein [Flavihumibacter sp. UBA7668]|uniref:Gfo/Idh/MocA family protein n=1 Tax=Flavihumibacter sp. UBA7668 TaxID=1946542 RepID=UPI0025BC479C|nr:Gfo/Idh/MocA family oxidoreductase [Flavihumibacter sp. UBA7668]